MEMSQHHWQAMTYYLLLHIELIEFDGMHKIWWFKSTYFPRFFYFFVCVSPYLCDIIFIV